MYGTLKVPRRAFPFIKHSVDFGWCSHPPECCAGVIAQRHAQALSQYTTEMTALDQELDAVLAATDDTVVRDKARAAFERLDRVKLGRAQQEFDPNQLPNRSLKSDLNLLIFEANTKQPVAVINEFADPADVLLREHDVLLVNLAPARIHKLNLEGKELSEFGDAEFNRLMREVDRQSRGNIRVYSFALKAAFVWLLSLIALLLAAKHYQTKWLLAR